MMNAGLLRQADGPICTGEPVAVKVLKAAAGAQAQQDLLHEAEIMGSFQHGNILSLRGIVVNGLTNLIHPLQFKKTNKQT